MQNHPKGDYIGSSVVGTSSTERVPHIEIGKAIIDATDLVREGLKNATTPSEIDAYVDILIKIDDMHWKNTEKVTLFSH